MKISQALPAALLTAGLIAGCSNTESTPVEKAQTIESEPTWTAEVPSVDTTPHTLPIYVPGDSARNLLMANADINIAYVPTTGDDEKALPDYMPYFLKFIAREKATMNSIKEFMITATETRYQPSAISVTETPPYDLSKDCIDHKNFEENERIRQLARPFMKLGQNNFIFVGDNSCDFKFAGFAGIDDIPILSTESSYETGDTALHEHGHSAGLNHANEINCENPITLTNCQTLRATDKNTLMGHTQHVDAQDFTGPEFYKLGLLEKAEILSNPSSGTYEISSMHDINRSATKVMIVATEKGNIFLSFEEDTEAAYDELCTPTSDNETYDPDTLYWTDAKVNGQSVRIKCNVVNRRDMFYSLQTRMFQKGFTNLITRPDRAPDPYRPNRSDGEVTPGNLIYRDKSVSVTFEGINADNHALVKITRR